MDLLASIILSAATIDAMAGVLFAIGFARRPSERDNGLAALLAVAAGAHAGGVITALQGGMGKTALLAANAFGWAGLVATAPLAATFTLAYRGRPRARRAFVAVCAAAFACGLLDVASGMPRATYAFTTVSAAWIVVFFARTYLSGQREALAVVMGGTIYLATSVHDLTVAVGRAPTGYLLDVGLAAFLASALSTRSARFAAVTLELERRTEELRNRTRELGRSYEELRAAQEELVKKEQLAVVGELAAVIAHEVRNPLAIISNAVAGLRRQAISRDDYETLLAILDEETSRLNRLVTDLLRYARPVNIQRADFLLADLLERTMSLVTKDHKAIQTDLRIEDHDARLSGDANLLRQVFDNLVVNAVQAMGTAGTLTVRVRSAVDDGVIGIAVDIIDTGEGMDTQVRSRARDPFFTTRPSGTGLGLAIVDRIVDAHGGRFSIESHAGEGTTVTVFLPRSAPNEPAGPRPRSTRPSAPRETGGAAPGQ